MKYIGLVIIIILLSSCSDESSKVETNIEKKDTSSFEIDLRNFSY
jgi:hypothetical protein